MNEAEVLFAELLNCDRLSLYLNKNATLDTNTRNAAAGVLKRRISGEPLEYILGKTEFMGLEFKVNKDVLIPRPETEILVETALKIVSGIKCQVSSVNILDAGTGSGCIAVSLAKLLSGVKIDAIDISEGALHLARENARLNNVSDKIRFIQSDLFASYVLPAGRQELGVISYDVIVSNPPYVARGDIKGLSREVQSEPAVALDGGPDGLDFYRRIIKESPPYLKGNGFLIMEMGFNQGKDIQNLLQESGYFNIIEVIKDYSNISRFVAAQKGMS